MLSQNRTHHVHIVRMALYPEPCTLNPETELLTQKIPRHSMTPGSKHERRLDFRSVLSTYMGDSFSHHNLAWGEVSRSSIQTLALEALVAIYDILGNNMVR